MIDDLRALAIFAKVAEAGSFSAAARSLRLSTSVVSHHVKGLEERHGVSLLHRSTRALSLTSEGQRLLKCARRMIDAAEEGFNAIADISAEPAGAIRVSAPAFINNGPQEKALWRFAKRYPNVAVTLHSSDIPVNMVAEGIDIGIRLGELSDSTLQCRKIGTFERRLVAAPSYLDTIDPPTSPTDLANCDFILCDTIPEEFVLKRGSDEITIHSEQSRILMNSVGSARSALIAGLGVQRLPLSEVEDDLAAGRLVQLLPEWSLPTLNIYAVWPPSSHRNSLVKLLLEYLIDA